MRIRDLGRVSDALLNSLKLQAGEFIRADASRGGGTSASMAPGYEDEKRLKAAKARPDYWAKSQDEGLCRERRLTPLDEIEPPERT